MIKAIIFDLDNTLHDFMRMKDAAVSSAGGAMIDGGLGIPKKDMIGKIYDVYDKKGIEDQKIFDKKLEKELRHINYKKLAAGIYGYRQAKESNLKLYPHVRETLTHLLKTGTRMVILSDAPRIQAWIRIYALGLADFFEDVITFEDTGERKPSPKPFQLALTGLNLKPNEVLMVGDWIERDMLGAKSVGIKTAYAKYGDISHEGVSGADFELNDVRELIDIVEKENKGAG
jgi:putative hydrolase of the HAD superfamily